MYDIDNEEISLVQKLVLIINSYPISIHFFFVNFVNFICNILKIFDFDIFITLSLFLLFIVFYFTKFICSRLFHS